MNNYQQVRTCSERFTLFAHTSMSLCTQVLAALNIRTSSFSAPSLHNHQELQLVVLLVVAENSCRGLLRTALRAHRIQLQQTMHFWVLDLFLC